MTKKILTALQYRRVSTSEQGDSGLGLAAQTSIIEDYAKRNGIVISGDYLDIKSGGKASNRPELQSALAAMREGAAEVLIVSHVSRLARNISDLSAMISEAAQFGYGIVCLDTGLDTTTPAGRLVVQMLGVAAEYERAITSERVTRAMAEAKKQGRHMGRRESIGPDALELIGKMRLFPPKLNIPPGVKIPGWTLEETMANLERDRKRPEWVATVAALRKYFEPSPVTEPAPFVEIAKTLEALEIPAPNGGKTWHVSTVTRAAKRLEALQAA